MHRLTQLGGFALCGIFPFGCSDSDRALTQNRATRIHDQAIEQAISWLPLDTETIIVAKGRMSLSTAEDSTELQMPHHFMVIGTPMFGALFNGIEAKYGVVGMRKFAPAGGLGLCKFEGCRIFSLQERGFRKLSATVAEKCKAAKQVGGLDTFEFLGKGDQREWVYSIVMVDGLCFVATSREYLEELLDRRKSKTLADRALPDSFELWKHVDKSSALWGIRMFTPEANQLKYGMNMDDEDLVGYAVNFDRQAESFIVTSVSRSTAGFERARKQWEMRGSPARASKVDDRTTRIIVGKPNKDEEFIGVILVLAALGHVVFF